MLAFLLLAKYHQKAMDKNGLQNSLKDSFFKYKYNRHIEVEGQRWLAISHIACKASCLQ
jgi:hypothetical protein